MISTSLLVLALFSAGCSSNSGLVRGIKYTFIGAEAEEEEGFRHLYRTIENERSELRKKIENGNVSNPDGTINPKFANLRNLDLIEFDKETDRLLDIVEALAKSTISFDMEDEPGTSKRKAQAKQEELIKILKDKAKELTNE